MRTIKEKIVVSWSGGKDSAYALHELMLKDQYEIMALMTNVVEGEDKIKMHGVRLELLKQQAESIGIPLEIIWVSSKSKNGEYELKTGQVLEYYKKQGATAVVFGDLFLADIKAFRDKCLANWGMKGLYPLWERPTKKLAQDMMESGFRTVLTCVDTQAMPETYAGFEYNDDLLKVLPETVDPCGENGEFHTFVYDGPIFKKEIPFKKGDYYMKDNRFYYCDIQSIGEAS